MDACGGMAAPTQRHLRRLKRIGRYLLGRPRAECLYPWQEQTRVLDSYTDSDWAGDKVSRKSTSAGCLMRGSHCIKTWAKRQQVIALSSAEAELYAGLRTASEGLGVQSLMHDMGGQIEVEVWIDSSSALALSHKTGLGKAKHIQIQDLWIQDAVKQGRIRMKKVPGEHNCADLMTKDLSAERMTYLMNLIGYRFPN
jgi:hypothetical protein